ncbi:hypothetical protein F4814DRAFT_447273 [Daldinia grandis]|nr:hypothetical protein F4814DRAFT_447273 [Daldinia grandis]
MAGNIWFIAGASSGFGRAIGFEALKRSDKVVATSRNLDKMADLKEAGALVLAVDEVSSFGISAVIIEPGFFRTEFLNNGGSNRMQAARPLTEEYKNTSVDMIRKRNQFNMLDNHQPGDVIKDKDSTPV